MNGQQRFLHRLTELICHPRPAERTQANPAPNPAHHRHVFDTDNGGDVDMRGGLWIIYCACGSGRLFGSW